MSSSYLKKKKMLIVNVNSERMEINTKMKPKIGLVSTPALRRAWKLEREL